MAEILVVGCGDLGSEIIRRLYALGHVVTGVRKRDRPLVDHIPCIQADITQAASLAALQQASPEIIIYCISANAQSDESYRQHYVDGLRNVIAAQQANQKLQHVFFISSTRVYGQCSQDVLDESDAPLPADFGGKRLLEAEGLLNHLPCGGTALRLAGIYGPGRLYMLNLAKAPERWPQQHQWTNRIHRDDAAGFVVHLCQKVIQRESVANCYIVKDDISALRHDVLLWLAKALGISPPIIHNEQKVSGKRLSNQRMHDSGYQLKYPSYQEGYKEILNDS